MIRTIYKTSLIATIGSFALVGSASSALIAENFQLPTVSDGTAAAVTGWTFQASSYKLRTTTADVPADTDFPGSNTNQVLQMENTGWARYELAHTWSPTDVFLLTFNAAPQAWNIANQRWVRPKIFQDGGTLLWDPGENAQTEIFWWDVATQGTNPYTWNGPGPYGNSNWQAEPDTFYSFTINAADFLGGTEGESIYFEYASSGMRGSYIDNISLTLIPEPTSVALLGFSAMGLIIRRRRN